MSTHLSLTKWCWAVTLWLASGFSVHAQGLEPPIGLGTLLGESSSDIHTLDEDATRFEDRALVLKYGGTGSAFCAASQTEHLTTAAVADGISNPADLIAALRVIWCYQHLPKPNRLQTLRLRLPSHYNKRGQVLSQAREGWTLWDTPNYVSIGIYDDGKRISVSTTREGGGDEFEWGLERGVWKLVRFVDGWAC
jgi:hypothetical protein